MSARIFFISVLFLSLLSGTVSAESPEQVLGALEGTVDLQKQKQILGQIVDWEARVILGERQFPERARRFDYLGILFSDKVIASPELVRFVQHRFVDLTKDSEWLTEMGDKYRGAMAGRREAQHLGTLISLRAYIEGTTQEWPQRPREHRTLSSRMAHMVAQLREARVPNWPALVLRGLVFRISRNGYEPYGRTLDAADFSSLAGVDAAVLTRVKGQLAAPAAVVSTVPAPPPARDDARREIVRTPITPLIQRTAPRTAPVSAPPRSQSVQQWTDLLRDLQMLERQLEAETVATRRSEMIARADELFERGRRLSNPVLKNLEAGDAPPVDLFESRRLRNEFADAHLDALRLEVFLPYLNGLTPGDIRGNAPAWNTPRTSALAAVALSFAVFRVKAQEGATEIANAISKASENYDAKRLAALNSRVAGFISNAFARSEAIYRRAVTEHVIGFGRNASTFVPSAADRRDLEVLALPRTQFQSEIYRPLLKRLGSSRSMEVFRGLMHQLANLENLLATSRSSADRQRVNQFADEILVALKTLGEGPPLGVTGERFHFSSGGTARRMFRSRHVLPYLSSPESPRLVAGALYGLAGAALHHRGTTSEQRLKFESTEGIDLVSALPPAIRDADRVRAAFERFQEAHSWEVPLRALPAGSYFPVDPHATAVPVQPTVAAGSDGLTAERSRFLPVEWATRTFIDVTANHADRELLIAIERFLPTSSPTPLERSEALATLRTRTATDLGVILALADALRENRLVAYRDHSGTTPPQKSAVDGHLLAALNRWTTNYRRVRTSEAFQSAGAERRNELLSTSVAIRLLAVSDSPAATTLERCESEAAPRLNRLLIASGDPALMEAGSRTLHSLPADSLGRKEREDASSRLRAILGDAAASDYFSIRDRTLFRRLLRRLDANSMAAVTAPPVPAPVTDPPPNPGAGTERPVARHTLGPEELHDSLNVLSGTSGLRLPAAALSAMWDALLIESLERGISDVRSLELLLEWVQEPARPVADRAQALRLLLHSYDHLATIFQTNTGLAEKMDEAIVTLRRELRQQEASGGANPVFVAVMEGFNRVRFGREAVAHVVRDVGKSIKCDLVTRAVLRW